MNCAEHQDWLQTYLDEAACPVPAEVEQHRRGCPVCHELFAAAQRLLAVVRLVPSPTPPAELRDRIVGAVRADRRRVFRFRGVVASAGLAASLLLAVYLARVLPRPVEVVERPIENIVVPKEPAPTLEADLHQATAAMIALTRRATDETVDQTRLLLPAIVPDLPLSETPAHVALNTPARSLREVQASVSEGLEPVASSWWRAVDLFRRNLPPMTPPAE